MDKEPSVDFLKKKYKLAPERKPRQKKKGLKFFGAFFAVVIISGLFFSYQVAKTPVDEAPSTDSFSIFSSVKRLITSRDKELVGEQDDRINFLLLGVGGAGHDGPELSDTMIFASFRPSTKEMGLMSIPRDLIVEIPDYGYRKINHANAYGEMEKTGTGPEKSKQVVSEMLDQDIHYTVKVNFNGFEELINAVSGVDVYVDNSFTDYTYPTNDELVQTISFEKGWTTMDGETALMFARSRHGNNGEGSDFARAIRQQKILLAVKDKVLSPSVILNPGKLNKMIDIFQNNVQTDLTVWEMLKLAKFAPDINSENMAHHVLDDSTSSPLYPSNINGSYVLLPKKDDWSEVRSIAEDVFTSTDQNNPAYEKKAINSEVAIEIQNGTHMSGLAFETSQLLSGTGFNVQKIGNADSRSYNKTIIYDLTSGTKANELAILKNFLEADVALSTEGWVYSEEVVPRELTVTTPGEDYIQSEEPIDFLVILGEDAQSLVLR